MSKPVRMIHPLAMAKSLEAQNQSLLFLFQAISDVVAYRNIPDRIQSAISQLEKQGDLVRAAFWPEETP